MPPTVDEDLSQGLKITDTKDGYNLTRIFFCYNLELPNVGDPECLRLASALSLPEIPVKGDSIVIDGQTLYVTSRDFDPFPPVDATVTVNYTPQTISVSAGAPDGPVTISGGTTVQQTMTDFDYANLQLPIGSRTAIQVTYDPTVANGAPATVTDLNTQGGSVPIYIANSTINYTRYENNDPSGRSRTYGGKTNSATWKGLAVNTVLCTGITFSLTGGNVYQVTYSFAYDPDEKWVQTARFIKSDTGKPPKLTTGQINGSNGITRVVTQGSADFNALGL